MISFAILGVSALFIICRIVEGTNLGLDQPHQPLEFPKARRLFAASLSSNLKARADPGIVVLSKEADFDFVHHDPEDDEEYVFAATLGVASQQPILALEDLDTDLNGITCSDSQVQLSLGSISRTKALKKELEALSEFVVVTSHGGCDIEGERSIHRVSKATVDLDSQVITLNKAKSDWHDEFRSIKVSFSSKHRSAIHKRSYRVPQKRQQEQTSAQTTSKVIEDGSAPQISFPTAPPVTTGLPPTATKSLNEHYIDRKIFPPDIPVAGMFIPQGVTVTCRNCTLHGNIEITKASFSLSNNSIEDTIAFFDDGALEIISNDLFAQVQLGLDLSLSQSLASLNISLPTIPLTPFEIPGVVAFGPIIQPQLSVSVDLVEKIGFSYGFNLSVPNDSKIKINMSEPRNSSISGFADTKFHALPFESTSPLASLMFSVTFTTQILLGVRTAKGMVSGGIGAFVNLPKVSVNATQLSHINEQCEPVTDKRKDEGSLESALENVFDSLTHITPSVDVNMGVLANLQVDVAHFSERAAVQAVLASTSYPLPTACLKFDPGSHKYGVPSHTPSATAISGSSKGGDAASSDSDKQSGAAKLGEGPDLLFLGVLVVALVAVVYCGWG